MATNVSEQTLLPSVLDRLIDPNSLGTSSQPWYSIDQLMNAVKRDIIALLNSRQTHQGLLDDYPECRESLLTFGLPDFTTLDASTAVRRADIGRQLEDVIRRFEPRLRDVRVTLTEPVDVRQRTLRYRVEAMMNIDAAPNVAFEVILELATGQYDVETE